MRETIITVTGNVGSAPTYFKADERGAARMVLSVATTRRVRDTDTGSWRDANTSWYDVWLNGRLADNALDSIAKGDAVIVTGSVEIRRWEDGDRSGHKAVISARAFGPDLSKYPVAISRARIVSGDHGADTEPAPGGDPEGYQRVTADGEEIHDDPGDTAEQGETDDELGDASDDHSEDPPSMTPIVDRLASGF